MTRLTATSAFISPSPLRRRACATPPAGSRIVHGPGMNARARERMGSSAVGAGPPEHVAGAAVVQPAAEHEEMIREAVKVFEGLRIDRFAAGELADQALGSPRDRAREMEVGGSRRTAG